MNELSSRIFWVIGLTWTFLFFSAEGLRVVSADTPVFQSGPASAVLIELYSEEGAASDLAAQHWIKSLQNSGSLWKNFVPANFYVNNSRGYGQRQRNYLRFWKSKKITAPNFFVNGKEWKNWAENSALPAPPDRKSGILKVENYGSGAFVVTYLPPKSMPGQWLVHGVLLDREFSVLDYEQDQLRKINGIFGAPLNLKSQEGSAAKSVAIWVTRDNSLIPVQAAGGYLPES